MVVVVVAVAVGAAAAAAVVNKMYRCDNFKTQLCLNGRILASRLDQSQNETKHIDLRQKKATLNTKRWNYNNFHR